MNSLRRRKKEEGRRKKEVKLSTVKCQLRLPERSRRVNCQLFKINMQPEIEQQIQQLRQQLQQASYAYYVLDAPMMADEVYDRLYRQLQELESDYP